ncbi:MAG: WD40 repeat domain-containing protein [Cyclobacteriaceae bacterium]
MSWQLPPKKSGQPLLTDLMVIVKKVNTYTGHQGAVYTIEGGNSNVIYSSGADGQVIEWDLNNPESGRLIAKIEASVYALKFIPLSNLLIIGQNFEGIHILDVEKKEEVGSLKFTKSQIFDIQLNGESILAGTGDGYLFEIALQDLAIRRKIKLSENSIRSIAISSDKGKIVVGCSDNAFRVLDSTTFEIVSLHEGHSNSVFSTVFDEKSDILITGSRDAHLKLWNVDNQFEADQDIVAHMYAINDISFHPDGHLFATASMDKTIKIWNFEKRKLLKVIDKARHNGHLTSVNKLYWSKHNNYLISGSDDRSLSVWDIQVNS